MKWLNTKLRRLTDGLHCEGAMRIGAVVNNLLPTEKLCCKTYRFLLAACFLTGSTLPAAAQQPVCVADSADMMTDTMGKTVELPDSIVRRLAAKLGMVDSTEARRRFIKELANDSLLHTELDTADTQPALSRYERHRRNRIKGWAKLIPNQSCLQYAGSIGLMSFGLGWHYGKGEHWETELLVGFLPRYETEAAKSTFTIKQRYVPWHCVLGSRWTIEPLTAGLFFNTISGDDFWKNQPDRYPKDYYGFSTKVRTNIFLGQRLRYNIPHSRRIFLQALSLYYEISTCDLYIVSKVTNKHYPWSKTLSLAIGLRCEM